MMRSFCAIIGLLASTKVLVCGADVRIARADFQNVSGAQSVHQSNPGLVSIQGNISALATAPTDGAIALTESSFGQPFSPFIPRTGIGGLPSYAAEIVAAVRNELYPVSGSTRATVLAQGAAFRYKWLLFSPEPGESDVTSHFQSMTNWFGDRERLLVADQIGVIRDALAVSPLDTGLRDLLLECYYDLATAEMQFAKQSLAGLAAKHLGLTLTSPFVIDDEIEIYEELIELEENVLAKYAELFTTTNEGVNPSEFDDRETGDPPMGLYTFLRQQPYRNAIASEYATEAGGVHYIPDYDEVNRTAKVRAPDNLVLFAGYKDYATILQIMGQYIQHTAEMGRLRGMRQGPNDLTITRNAFSRILGQTATDFQMLKALVPVQILPGDASGIGGAIIGVEAALADITNVRAFINGTANILGLDPNFLLLVQSANLPGAGQSNESFDVIYGLLKGPNQPLGDALAKLSTATAEYRNFRASVDRVVESLDNVDDTFKTRFVEITGYEVDETPGFQGFAKPNSGAELLAVENSIASLNDRNEVLGRLSSQIQTNLEETLSAVSIASELDETVDAAEEIYISTTRPMYKDLIEWNMYSDIAQATADGVYATAGVDPLNAPGHLASVIATMANIPIQEVAALRTGGRQQDIDYASVGYQSALQKADNKLTINQALQGVGTVKREQLGNALESIDNALAMSQAVAQRASLLREVDRITAARDSSSATIRKSYYADPIHYVRSENALILADAAFRNAQRWVFYAQRALEYKWQQRFSASENSAQGVRSFDSGTLFKLRNAAELDDLLTQLKNWNDVRLIEDTRSIRTTFVSLLDDVLAPNPNANNLTPALRVDPGVRFDALTGNTVTKREYFRRLLDRARDPNGNIVINIDTVQLAGLDGSFFLPPNYSTTPLSPGEWRDKIVYLKVNIIADDGDFSDPKSKPGSLTYGGQMFFRTRIPPCPLSPGVTSTNDLPGEFFTAPFRYYSSANFDNAFTYQTSQTQNIPIAYTDRSAVTPTGDEILGPSFQINNFNQRSVATTELALTIFASANLDVSKIRDIELIVRHSSSARLAPICP